MTKIGEEDTKTSEDEKTRPFASNTAKVKLRLEPLHTLHTNPFIYSSLHHHHASSFSPLPSYPNPCLLEMDLQL